MSTMLVDLMLDNSQTQIRARKFDSESETFFNSEFSTTFHTFQTARVLGPHRFPTEGEPFSNSLSALGYFDQKISSQCSAKYGTRMLDSFRNTTHPTCQGSKSSIICHERVSFDSHYSRYMCKFRDVDISENHTTVRGCQLKRRERPSNFSKIDDIIFGHKFTRMKYVHANTKFQCKEYVFHKVLVQSLWDTNNFYEWYSDWVTLWESLVVLDWKPMDVEMFLIGDLSGDGHQFKRPFDEAWSMAFQKKGVRVGSFKALFNKGICFSDVATVPYGSLSTFTSNDGRGGFVKCGSPTLMASAFFLETIFGVGQEQRTGKRVTLILRRGQRAFRNDQEAEKAVKEALPVGWEFNSYTPENVTSLAEQLTIAQHTDVLVGVHGAAMTHLLFLPPRARIVEIFCMDRFITNRHYRNLEVMADEAAEQSLEKFYFTWVSGNCMVDTPTVRRAIDAYDKAIEGKTNEDKRG